MAGIRSSCREIVRPRMFHQRSVPCTLARTLSRSRLSLHKVVGNAQDGHCACGFKSETLIESDICQLIGFEIAVQCFFIQLLTIFFHKAPPNALLLSLGLNSKRTQMAVALGSIVFRPFPQPRHDPKCRA